MDPAVKVSQVEMNVLQRGAAQVDPNGPVQPQAGQESSGFAPQDHLLETPTQSQSGQESNGPAPKGRDSPSPPDEATKRSLPRIFEKANLEDVLRDISSSCTPEETATAWSKTTDIVKTYGDDMIGRWNSEIDTLLVYAGLFSAILTAFNVESYKLLQPAAPDPTLVILERMSAQLRSFSVANSFINSTEPHYTAAIAAAASPPTPTRADVWLNILWFSGLICSLSSASIAIMVKQWLRELSTRPSGTPQEVAQIRQYRLNNLIKWRVAGIVSTLPMLLQLSLILFLSGLLVLLWTLHAEVATASSALVGLLLTFMAVTIVLPAFKADCCYISPPTHAILPLAVRLRRLFFTVARSAVETMASRGWMGLTYAALERWLCHSWEIVVERPESSTWSIREVQKVTQPQQSRDLAVDQIILAYSLTLQSGYLNQWGRICLMDGSLGDVGFVMAFIDRMRDFDTRRLALGLNSKRQLEDLEVWLYILLRLAVSVDGKHAGEECRAPCLEAGLVTSNMTLARSYISASIFGGHLDRCRPDARVRILKILPSLTPIITQDNSEYNLRHMRELVMLLTRCPGLGDTWNRAQYLAKTAEELLQCPAPPLSHALSGPHRSVDMMGVLVACAELKDTPEAVATQMRSLALHEGTRMIHLLHDDGVTGRPLMRNLAPSDFPSFVDLLRKLKWVERRCHKAGGSNDAPWIDTVDEQSLPPISTRWSSDKVMKYCEQYIPSFSRPMLCPMCPRGQPVPQTQAM